MIKCYKCKKDLYTTDKYCKYCGSKAFPDELAVSYSIMMSISKVCFAVAITLAFMVKGVHYLLTPAMRAYVNGNAALVCVFCTLTAYGLLFALATKDYEKDEVFHLLAFYTIAFVVKLTFFL